MSLTNAANLASGAWDKSNINILESQIAEFNHEGGLVNNIEAAPTVTPGAEPTALTIA